MICLSSSSSSASCWFPTVAPIADFHLLARCFLARLFHLFHGFVFRRAHSPPAFQARRTSVRAAATKGGRRQKRYNSSAPPAPRPLPNTISQPEAKLCIPEGSSIRKPNFRAVAGRQMQGPSCEAALRARWYFGGRMPMDLGQRIGRGRGGDPQRSYLFAWMADLVPSLKRLVRPTGQSATLSAPFGLPGEPAQHSFQR